MTQKSFLCHDNVIPFPVPLPMPSPERMREIYALADAYWPEYERALEEREALEGKMHLLPKRGLRLVRP